MFSSPSDCKPHQWIAPCLTPLGITKNTPRFSLSIGQRVIWNYQARSNSEEIWKIPAEVVKLSGKSTQIKIRQKNGEFITRWVSASKLEIR